MALRQREEDGTGADGNHRATGRAREGSTQALNDDRARSPYDHLQFQFQLMYRRYLIFLHKDLFLYELSIVCTK
jgi:hypothetical protein